LVWCGSISVRRYGSIIPRRWHL